MPVRTKTIGRSVTKDGKKRKVRGDALLINADPQLHKKLGYRADITLEEACRRNGVRKLYQLRKKIYG